MIENSERGITINKSLAYTLVCGLLGLGLYVGTTVAQLKSSIEGLDSRIAMQSMSSEAREIRVRTLENGASRFDERIANIQGLLVRIDGRLERIERSQNGEK